MTPPIKGILENILWGVIAKVINVVSGILVGVFVARYLGPSQYGLMNYVVSYVTIFSILASFGIDSILVREIAKKEIDKEILLGSAFGIRVMFAIFTILLVYLTLLSFETNSFTRKLVLFYSFSLVFSSFNVIRNYFTAIVMNKYVMIVDIFKTVLISVMKLCFVFLYFSLFWFVFSLTLEFIFTAIGLVYVYNIHGGNILRWRFKSDIVKILLHESFPLVLSGAAIVIYQKIDQIMIHGMINDAALGQFAVATKFTQFVVFLPILIVQVVMPVLVKIRKNDGDEYKKKRQQFLDLIVWSSFFIAFFIAVFARAIISFLYGIKYTEAIPVLQIMAWKAVFAAMFVSSGQLIIVENLQKYAVFRNLLGCIVSVLLNFLFIPKYGINGAALATIFTIAFSGYLAHVFIKPYRYMFRLQTSSIICGWKRLAVLANKKIKT